MGPALGFMLWMWTQEPSMTFICQLTYVLIVKSISLKFFIWLFLTLPLSFVSFQIQTSIQSHAIIILPNTDGIELLVCYEDEGVYVNTYGRITKDVVLQWGEMPTSVGELITPTMLFTH